MIKVLMIGNHPSNKGGMTSVINQIRKHDWTQEDVNLSFIPTFIPGNSIKKALFFAWSYLRIMWRLVVAKPDIIHMHMSYKGSFTRKYYVHKLCRSFHVKDIIHLHGSEFKKWYDSSSNEKKRKVQKLLFECDAFVVLGEEWKDAVHSIQSTTRIRVISNGIEIPEKIVKWDRNGCNLLFLGVLIPRKGVSDLINSLAMIKNEGKLGKVHLTIAGTGELEDSLKQQVIAQGLSDVVSFVGWVSGEEKRQLILKSQIMVSASYNEGLPISILEAASYGMPIISTNVGDISSVVVEGVNGHLFKPGDVNALSKNILESTDEVSFAKMSQESRRIIEESFSIEMFYKKLSDLYHYVGESDGKH